MIGQTRYLSGSNDLCVKQYIYIVDTPYLPIYWVVGFGADDTVVVKFQLE